MDRHQQCPAPGTVCNLSIDGCWQHGFSVVCGLVYTVSGSRCFLSHSCRLSTDLTLGPAFHHATPDAWKIDAIDTALPHALLAPWHADCRCALLAVPSATASLVHTGAHAPCDSRSPPLLTQMGIASRSAACWCVLRLCDQSPNVSNSALKLFARMLDKMCSCSQTVMQHAGRSWL